MGRTVLKQRLLNILIYVREIGINASNISIDLRKVQQAQVS